MDIRDIIEVAKTDNFQFIPLQHQHISQYTQVPLFEQHRDPFDRLIVAIAKSENMQLVSADEKMKQYATYVQVIEVM